MVKFFFGLFTVVSCLGGCTNKGFEITNEYIINPNWSKKGEEDGANTIEIKRMKLKKDSVINNLENVTQIEILNKLEYDSVFCYFANVKIGPQEDYQTKKIYFNKENDFYWIGDDYGSIKKRVIGKLKDKNWYQISKLDYYSYVIYIDSLEKEHRYLINQSNY